MGYWRLSNGHSGTIQMGHSSADGGAFCKDRGEFLVTAGEPGESGESGEADDVGDVGEGAPLVERVL